MTIGLILFASGAACFLLLAYGVVRDVVENREVRVVERPPRAEPIDYRKEIRPVSKLPKRVPDSPWSKDEAA